MAKKIRDVVPDQVRMSNRAVTRIAPNESQGVAGQGQYGSAEAAAAFKHQVGWDAPGQEDCCSGFGEGFKKPRA